jgi:cytochrome P450
MHAQQRRKFASAYTMSSLVSYERFVDNCSRLLISRLHELSNSHKSFDVFHWLQCYAFDVIGEITFGARFGLLDSGDDTAGIFNAIDSRTVHASCVGVYHSWKHYLTFLMSKTVGHAALQAFAAKALQKRELQFQDPDYVLREGAPDFITKFLTVHNSTPEKISRTDLLAICQSNIGAGSDTTAIALSSIVFHLMKFPNTYFKLREEILRAETENKISSPITFKESTELPYLQAVIKEALRIHPSVGLGLQRVVPPGGRTIAGRYVPAGSTVGVNAWVAHRNKDVFGEDANEWRPERWLEIEKDGRGAEVEKYFLAFGMGSRTCIGKNISLLEMGKLIPELVKRFKFEFKTGD